MLDQLDVLQSCEHHITFQHHTLQMERERVHKSVTHKQNVQTMGCDLLVAASLLKHMQCRCNEIVNGDVALRSLKCEVPILTPWSSAIQDK